MKTLLNFYKLPRPHFYRSPFPGAVVLETTKDRATQGTRWLWWHCRAKKARGKKMKCSQICGFSRQQSSRSHCPAKKWSMHKKKPFILFTLEYFYDHWYCRHLDILLWKEKRERTTYYTIFPGLELRVPISQVRGNVVFAEANGWQIWVLLLLLSLRADSCRLGKPGGQTGWGKVVAVCQSRDERL